MHYPNEGENSTNSSIDQVELLQLQRTAKAMDIIEKFAPWKPMCYNRALTAKKILKQKNIDVRMHIGFRKKEDVFDGHAWITYKGKIVTGYLKGLNKFKEMKPLKY